ncbi:MAG: hypothetical protein CV090_11250 [Nitrospira sp. WS238]|nr:hypothetical protein [Nitrospira sp. WS238]
MRTHSSIPSVSAAPTSIAPSSTTWPAAGSEVLLTVSPNRRTIKPDCIGWYRIKAARAFRSGGFRFYIFSREEARIHVHVYCERGEAKFWLEPKVDLAKNIGLTARQIQAAKLLIEEHFDEIRNAWETHFKS